MRRILLPILALSGFFGFSANAQTLQKKWEGYKPVTELRSLNLPFQEFAENSVYKIQSVGLIENSNEKIEILDMQNDPRAQNRVTDKKTVTTVPLHFQIETCRKQNLRYCPIFKEMNDGTIFFNNGHLYTCRHIFHNWLALAAEANGISVSEISPPMILSKPSTKKKGQFTLIYQSAFITDPLLKFSMINSDKKLNYLSDYRLSYDAQPLYQVDYVEMSVENSQRFIDYSLPLRPEARRSIQKNEEVYMFGYPRRTEFLKKDFGDSPGLSLLASHGFTMDYMPFYTGFESSSYSSGGASGGAVISAQGELLGINCGGFEKDNPAQSTSYFLPIDKKAVLEGWNQIDYSVLGTKQAQTDTTN